jgi:hypothetical protein
MSVVTCESETIDKDMMMNIYIVLDVVAMDFIN